MTPDFADAPEIALDDPRAGVRIVTNTATVLAAQTRYARATAVAVEGRVAPGERVTLRATAGTAWRMVPEKDKDGRVRLVQRDTRPATDAELRQLRWRAHSGGALLVDQRPGAAGDAVTLTLPARLPGETMVACAYNYQPTVNTHLHWWVEDPREPGGKRSGRGGRLEDLEQLARIMGYADAGAARAARAHVHDAYPVLLDKLAGLDTLQQAHFLAQVAHETGGLQDLRERTSDAAAGAEYADKNGNEGPEDGAAFKGRGVLQITGYVGYRDYFARVERAGDLPRTTLRRRAPELERMPAAVYSGLHFWAAKRCDERAAVDDALGVSIRVNGWDRPAYLPKHYAARLAALQRAKREFGLVR